MIQFYLRRSIHLFFFATLLICFFISLWSLFIFTGLIYGTCLFLFRQKGDLFREGVVHGNDEVFAPINGRVMEVLSGVDHPIFGKNLYLVRFNMSFRREYGVYLPLSSEVREFVIGKRSGIYRLSQKFMGQLEKRTFGTGYNILFEGKNHERVGLQLVRCLSGLLPSIDIMAGDRGKMGANIGFFPFGGTALLYLPDSYEILVNIDDEVIAGETLIGGHTSLSLEEK